MSPANPGVASTDILAILVVTCQGKENELGDLSSRKIEHDRINWTYNVYIPSLRVKEH
jgi:hypothetical protein